MYNTKVNLISFIISYIHHNLGVIFALKVLMNTYYPNDNERILGFLPVPGRYSCWAELVIIQLLTPNVSFVGHLAGILVGLLYTCGPLAWIAEAIYPSAYGYQAPYGHARPTAPPEETYDYGSQSSDAFSGRGATTGGSFRGNAFPSAPPEDLFSGSGATTGSSFEDYTGGLSEEEQMRRATEESLRHRRGGGGGRTNYGWNLD